MSLVELEEHSSSSFEGTLYNDPFPHLIVENFYNEEELSLIWEELNFYTKPGKLLPPDNFGGIPDKTNARALWLDAIYRKRGENGPDYSIISNILNVTRKIFHSNVIDLLSTSDISCRTFTKVNCDTTKVRYYHNGEYYKSHTDATQTLLAFSYFYKEPKKFTGGELYFPPYDYEFSCPNNSLILFPGYVEHGVKKVKIKDSDYYDGEGRYCISTFASIESNPERMKNV